MTPEKASPEEFLREFAKDVIERYADGDPKYLEAVKGWAKLLKLREDAVLNEFQELGHKSTMRKYDPVSWQAGYNKGYQRGRANAHTPLTTPNNTTNALEDEGKDE